MTINTIKFDISTIDSNDIETKLCSRKVLLFGLGIMLVGCSKLLYHLGNYLIRKVNAQNSRFQRLTIVPMKMYSLPNSQQMKKQGDLCVTDHSCNNLDTFHVLTSCYNLYAKVSMYTNYRTPSYKGHVFIRYAGVIYATQHQHSY